VAEIDPALAVYDVHRVDERVAEAVAPAQFIAIVTAAFALSTAALAALGVFGVMAYSVSNRRDELALRIALGASRAALRRSVLRRTAVLAMVGCAAGIALGLWLLPAIRAMLYDVSPFDPVTIGSAALAMASIAVVSAAVPAARASAADPLTVLRR